MTDIGRVDQVILQLRAQLQRAANTRAKGKAGSTPETQNGPLQRLAPIIGKGKYDQEEHRRKFVRALLTEELGEQIGNEAEFERISNQVWQLLEEDEQSRELMDLALGELDQNR